MTATAFPTRWRVVSACYVVVVMVVMALAMIDPNDPRQRLLIAAGALCLPTILPALPPLYLTLATVWNVTDADSGGPTWPVTVAYAVAIGLVAVANVWLVSFVVRGRQRSRSINESG